MRKNVERREAFIDRRGNCLGLKKWNVAQVGTFAVKMGIMDNSAFNTQRGAIRLDGSQLLESFHVILAVDSSALPFFYNFQRFLLQ